MIVEACVESYTEALIATSRGADQIELCANLKMDGLTPELNLIKRCIRDIPILTKVMLRPRAGSFVYSYEEFESMLQLLPHWKKVGVKHIVYGIITNEKTLDIDRIAILRDAAYPMRVTIHKAIDMCHEPVAEAKRLYHLGGIHSILTSGGATTAIDGAATINAMHEAVFGQIQIIAAGKITDSNLTEINKTLHVVAFHGRRIVGKMAE